MRIIAPMMILIMMTSTLAGCTGGDPDGGGNDEIDMDILNQLIDNNLQDFINNTTITVENHYHNNTTISNDNTDNSVSNINGSGSLSSPTMQMFTVNWNRTEHVMNYLNTNIQPGEKMVTLTGTSNNSGSGDNTLLFSYAYNGYVIEFRFNCNEYKHYQQYWNDEHWEDWLIDNYGSTGDWRDTNNLGRDIENDFDSNYNNGFNAYQQCGLGINEHIDKVVIYQINLDQGEAISILVNGQYVTTNVDCVDGYSIDGVTTEFIGGQSDCVVSGISPLVYRISSTDSGIFDSYSGRNISSWEYFTDYSVTNMFFSSYVYSAFEEFAVYFNLHEVVVYDLEE